MRTVKNPRSGHFGTALYLGKNRSLDIGTGLGRIPTFPDSYLESPHKIVEFLVNSVTKPSCTAVLDLVSWRCEKYVRSVFVISNRKISN